MSALRALLRRQSWLFGIGVGAALGLLILGVGGRLAMRLIALRAGPVLPWTVGGTATVLAMGALSGASGGALRAAIGAWLPRRAPQALQTTLFALACLLLTLRGLKPLDTERLVLFLPLTAAYVTALELAWRRRRRSRTG